MSDEQAQTSTMTRDILDDKVNRVFAGKVVRKDLVRKVKVGANVPVFVLEYLLGKYCASSDEMAIQMGLQVVNDTLADNYIRPDESTKAQSKVKEAGKHTFIDKVKVRLVDSQYWAEVTNFGHKVRPRSRPLRPRLRPPAHRGHLGPDRHAFRVRRRDEGQVPLLDRQAHPHPARHVRPRGVPRAARRADHGRVARPDGSQHGLRARGHGASAEAALPHTPHSSLRAQLQPRGARSAWHRQGATRSRSSLPTRRC